MKQDVIHVIVMVENILKYFNILKREVITGFLITIFMILIWLVTENIFLKKDILIDNNNKDIILENFNCAFIKI